GFHLNLLSREGDLAFPVSVADDLVRLDLRHWRLDPLTWEKLAKIDPYFHTRVKPLKDARVEEVWPGDSQYRRGVDLALKEAGSRLHIPAFWLPAAESSLLRHKTYSEAPILSGEWFFVQSARQLSLRNKQEGVGYYDWLGLKDRGAFFRVIGLNEREAIRLF